MDRKRRCTYEGCRAWARRQRAGEGDEGKAGGRPLCGVHAQMVAGRRVGAPTGNQYARKHGLYASYVPLVVLEQALNLPPGDLRLEIAVVRGILAELVKTKLEMPELVEAVDKATNSLARLLRTNHHLGKEGPDDFQEGVLQVLKDLGRA